MLLLQARIMMQSVNMNDMIIYDQPLNEIIRVCLRLEQLFEQIDHQLNDTSTMGTRNVLSYIINVLHILDRPDLKSKLAKELTHHHANFVRYGHLPNFDQERFAKTLQQLDEFSRSLIDSSGKVAWRLRDIELLNTLRMHLASPGGGCSFDIPLYHFWLQQPALTRQEVIKDWLTDFAQIRSIVALVLDIVRNGKRRKTAVHIYRNYDPQ